MSGTNREINMTVSVDSPIYVGARAYVEQLDDGAKVTCSDKNGTTTALVKDGKQGIQGERSEQGIQGEKGDAYVITEADYEAISQDAIAMYGEDVQQLQADLSAEGRYRFEADTELGLRCDTIEASVSAETSARQNTDAELRQKLESLAIKSVASGQTITLTDSAEYPLQKLTIYGKSTQDGTPTPTNPIEIVDVVNPNVTVCGKNMLNIKTCINGKAVSDKTGNEFEYQAYCTDFIPVRENANYYYSGMIRLNNGNTGAMYDKDKKYVSGIKNDTDIQPITIPQGVAYVRLNMYKDYWSNNDVSIAQLEQGTTATSYEPYITPQTQQFSCTLRGIGDIRDELTVGGQCVQRVGVVDLNDIVVWTDTSDASSSGIQNAYGFAGKCPSLKSNKAIMCNMFRTSGLVVNRVTNTIGADYNIRIITDVADNLNDFRQWIQDNRVIIYSPLTEPIITDNTDTLTLDSYYPTTNIYSDSNAELEVEYVADTKNYIDNQILELSATMVDVASMSLLDE